MTRQEVLGPLRRDPTADLLGTGYQQFSSPLGVRGLCKMDGPGVEVLAILAEQPGTGQCRAFVAACQQAFPVVTFWEVSNRALAGALRRYGFMPLVAAIDGEIVSGLRWVATGDRRPG